MKIFGTLFSILLSSFLTLTSFANMPYERFSQQPAVMAPDFSLPGTSEQEIRLSDYRGKIVLLNFWATFCAPCRMEMPSLQAISVKYQNDDVVVIAVSVDSGREKAVKKWIKKMKLEFPIALEGNSAGNIYEVSALPVTFIIGKKGQLIGRILGEREWNNKETHQFIDNLLSQVND
jgi:cytochrome c biogenesis protein CcmG, thiol:disulfide interchange protein DsbE